MAYVLVEAVPTIQVRSPTLVVDGLACTIVTRPHGSIVGRFVPRPEFESDTGAGLLNSLADMVEQILGEGIATAAAGVQGVDASGLIYDAVSFTVSYVPPGGSLGAISADVEVPVNTLTLDTQFGSFIPGPTPAEAILATYNHLVNLAGG